MDKLLNKSERIKKAILRGCNTYEDFLLKLKELKAPSEDFETFVNYMAYDFYNTDDFFAILIIIEQELNAFEEYKTKMIVFRKILEEIMIDYEKLVKDVVNE